MTSLIRRRVAAWQEGGMEGKREGSREGSKEGREARREGENSVLLFSKMYNSCSLLSFAPPPSPTSPLHLPPPPSTLSTTPSTTSLTHYPLYTNSPSPPLPLPSSPLLPFPHPLFPPYFPFPPPNLYLPSPPSPLHVARDGKGACRDWARVWGEGALGAGVVSE